MINRTSENNALFIWDETNDKFKFGTTTQDGSTVTDFSNLTLAKVEVAEPQADSDASTKKYVDDSGTSLAGTLSRIFQDAVAAVTGMTQELSTPDRLNIWRWCINFIDCNNKSYRCHRWIK